VRLKRTADDEAAYPYIHALRELFGLDAETAPVGAEDAEVTPIGDRRRAREKGR
jgi:hypothetical protein